MNDVELPVHKMGAILENAPVAGAWLFGSARDGRIRQGSDVDVGVLFETKPSLDVLADLRARLQRALEFEEIDVIPLNDASPILRFEALSGKQLCCRDEDRCAEFASLTAREYEDEMALCERWTASLETEGRRAVAELRAGYETATSLQPHPRHRRR